MSGVGQRFDLERLVWVLVWVAKFLNLNKKGGISELRNLVFEKLVKGFLGFI